MYSNSAYLFKPHEDITNNSMPLLITAVGNYRVHTAGTINVRRKKGRKDYQLIFVASGSVRFVFGGKEKIVSKGNAVIFNPNEPQIYYSYITDKPETYWVHFTGNNVEQLFDYYNIPNNESFFYVGDSTEYQHIFRQMIQELQLTRANFKELLQLRLQQLFLLIDRHIKESKVIKNEMLDEIKKAINYFNENYNKNIIIEDYAVEHFMTPCWFIQNFKQITKSSPMQYIISLRITSAMNLLDNTGYNITQIASAVGYENTQYFHRLFKKHTGMTPSEYKKRNKT